MHHHVGTPSIRPLRSPDRPEFFNRFEAELAPAAVKITTDGLRLTVRFDGRVTRGAFVGHRVEGTDQMLLRPDGVVVLDQVKTIAGSNRQVVEHLRGYAIPPVGFEPPTLESVLDPDFAWPDAAFAIVGSATFEATGELGEHLNRTIAVVDGWCNFATGGLAVETRLLPVNRHVAGPLTRAGARRFTVDQAVTGALGNEPVASGEAFEFEPLAPAVPITSRPTESGGERRSRLIGSAPWTALDSPCRPPLGPRGQARRLTNWIIFGISSGRTPNTPRSEAPRCSSPSRS